MIDNENDILIRVLYNYFTQGVWAVMLGLLLIYFYRSYRNSYLKRWSWSWFALSAYMLCAGIALYSVNRLPYDSPYKITISTISIIGAYLQPLWLIIGSYELVKRQRFGRKRELTLVSIAIILAFITTLTYAFGIEYVSQRIFLRVGVRSFVTGICFLGVSIWLLRYYKRENGIGHKIMTIAFLVYGFEQVLYFVYMFIFFQGSPRVFEYSVYSGLIDILLQVVMGVGMVVWLLEDAKRELEKAHKELDSFLYSTSHDLRSPIASVLGLTHVAKVDAKHAESAQYFEMIEKRIKNLDEIIEDILNYSKVTKIGITTEELSFNRLVKEVMSNVKFNPGASKISFEYDQKDTNVLNTSYNQIKIILNNLVSNAVKYHNFQQENPFVKITFSKAGTDVIIRVIDNGSGIEEENIDQIFDMFYRASSKSEGSGLGLYIANEAALKIHGELSVTSKKGVGTTFTLHFDEKDLGNDRI